MGSKIAIILDIKDTTLISVRDFQNFLDFLKKNKVLSLKEIYQGGDNIIFSSKAKDLISDDIKKRIRGVKTFLIFKKNPDQDIKDFFALLNDVNINIFLAFLDKKDFSKMTSNQKLNYSFVSFNKNSNLKSGLLKFLKKIESGDNATFFNIKYTLRVSKKINGYLNWKAKSLGIKKADWLRDEIIINMKKDKWS